MAEPVWEPNVLMIRSGRACIIRFADHPTINDALDACWQHLASLPPLADAG